MRSRAFPRLLLAAAAVAAVAVAGCGSSNDAPAPTGLVISGPGLQTSQPATQSNQPAWKPEYVHLKERLKQIGIPPGGQEKFHIHAMVRLYINGLLAPLPADIGLDPSQGIESSMHTHDGTGIVHMEAPHPFAYTLGDFFQVWGVKLGPEQVGGLKGLGGEHLHFYLNGKPLTNPAALVLHRNDSIVIGYGADSSFPHNPSTVLLSEVEKGEGGLGCGKAKNGQHKSNCLAPTKPKGAQQTSTTSS